MAHAVKLTNADAIAACVKDIMDKMQERGGLKDVYAVACGGSLSGCYPLFYLLRSEAKQLHSDCISANEFVYGHPQGGGKKQPGGLYVPNRNNTGNGRGGAQGARAGRAGGHAVD